MHLLFFILLVNKFNGDVQINYNIGNKRLKTHVTTESITNNPTICDLILQNKNMFSEKK